VRAIVITKCSTI